MGINHNQSSPKRDVAEDKYIHAFIKYFKCPEDDFQVQEAWENGPFLALYKDNVYRIANTKDISNMVKEMLNYEEQAIYISIGIWKEVAEGVHLEARFKKLLMSNLKDKEEINLMTQIFALGENQSFWDTLYKEDPYSLYPKAIVAASKIYNMEEDLECLLIENGQEELNQIEGGIFEPVCLSDDEDFAQDADCFFIYSADPAEWEDEL